MFVYVFVYMYIDLSMYVFFHRSISIHTVSIYLSIHPSIPSSLQLNPFIRRHKKVNPVIPEVMNMCAFEAIGLSVEKLRSGRELDGHMNKGET